MSGNLNKRYDNHIFHSANYCVNAIHFLALGVMPEIDCPTYAALRNRNSAKWYKPTVWNALNKKFKF